MIKIKKFSIIIAPSFMLLAAGFCLFVSREMTLALVIGAVVHELGHLLGFALTRARVTGVRLSVMGFVLEYDGANMSYLDEMAAVALGPVMSLFFAVVIGVFTRFSGWEHGYLIAGQSAIMFAFNLLPMRPLDGGRLLYMLLAQKTTLERADRVMAAFDTVCELLICLIGILLFIKAPQNLLTLAPIVFFLVKRLKMV